MSRLVAVTAYGWDEARGDGPAVPARVSHNKRRWRVFATDIRTAPLEIWPRPATDGLIDFGFAVIHYLLYCLSFNISCSETLFSFRSNITPAHHHLTLYLFIYLSTIPSCFSQLQLNNKNKTYTMILSFKNEWRGDRHKVPETKNIEEGSARRNIARKHDHDPNK